MRKWIGWCGWAAFLGAAARAEDARWFPEQAPAAGVVRTTQEGDFPAPNAALRMLVQSAAGLAAQSVNEGRGDELVWVATTNPDLEGWYARALRRPGAPEPRGELEPWALVERLRKAGVVRGYVLYRADRSEGEVNAHRPGLDPSVNVATSLCGVLGGVLVEEAVEPEARRRGLERLADARGMTPSRCLETYRDRFSRRMLVCQDPRKPNVRDLAVAHRAFTVYGDDPAVKAALEWLEPLSPVIGWNGGDELETTRLSTVLGQFQTATDWCMNLPVLMAGSSSSPPPRVEPFDPATIDWSDPRSAVSFVMTDGDNVQWFEGGFYGRERYWSSPGRGAIPFGWSTPFAHLAQLAPMAIDRAREERRPNDGFIEWGGGYYYPDLFGRDRPDRWKLLAEQARRTGEWMQRTGTRILGFNLTDVDSPDALRAYETIAGATRGLAAIFAFQYAPYEAGGGKVLWAKDADGFEVPIVTARYAIWEHVDPARTAGTPAKVARLIREADAAGPGPRYDWALVHAWSYFRRAPGDDEAAEEIPQAEGPSAGVRGYDPAVWCAERLPASIRVAPPDELAWRIRMKHDPDATARALRGLRP